MIYYSTIVSYFVEEYFQMFEYPQKPVAGKRFPERLKLARRVDDCRNACTRSAFY